MAVAGRHPRLVTGRFRFYGLVDVPLDWRFWLCALVGAVSGCGGAPYVLGVLA